MDNNDAGSTPSERDASSSVANNISGGTNSTTSKVLAKVGEAAQQAGGQVREKAGALAADAGEKAKGLLNNQVEAGADFLGNVSRSVTAAADTLATDTPQLAGLVRGMATSVADLSNSVRGQSPDALLETTATYIRQNPALVLSAAAICGFALTRFLQGGTWNGSRSSARGPTLAGSRSDAF
jgi:ElaB/YqjD/DUF883 family membrane-anchored ribosome-binding protein